MVRFSELAEAGLVRAMADESDERRAAFRSSIILHLSHPDVGKNPGNCQYLMGGCTSFLFGRFASHGRGYPRRGIPWFGPLLY